MRGRLTNENPRFKNCGMRGFLDGTEDSEFSNLWCGDIRCRGRAVESKNEGFGGEVDYLEP